MPQPRSEVERIRRLGAPRPAANAADLGSGRSEPLGHRDQLGVGVDLVDVSRFARVVALRGTDLTTRVFTPDELATCHGSLPRLAARFAAKEAVAKALALGIGELAWRDIEVRRGDRGEPELALAGSARRAARARGLDHWAVSLTHDATSAVAVVVATGEHGTGCQR